MNEAVERAVLERRIKALEDEARINKEFRNYVTKRLEAISHESETSMPLQETTGPLTGKNP